MPEKNETSAPNFAWLRTLFVGMLALLAFGVIVVFALHQVTISLRSALTQFDPDAVQGIETFLGAPLPASARDLVFRQNAQFTTASFAMPPGDYAVLIARARPVIETACWILPLKPEGVQARKPGCGNKILTLSVDKTNAALWRITIDLR